MSELPMASFASVHTDKTSTFEVRSQLSYLARHARKCVMPGNTIQALQVLTFCARPRALRPKVAILQYLAHNLPRAGRNSMRNPFGGRRWHAFWMKGANLVRSSGDGLPWKAGGGRPQFIQLVRSENTGAEPAPWGRDRVERQPGSASLGPNQFRNQLRTVLARRRYEDIC